MKTLFKNKRFLILLVLIFIGAQNSVFAKPKIKTKSVKPLFDITKADGKALSLPTDVTTHGNKIYIVDGDNHRILVFSDSGKFIFSFGKKRQGKGQFFFPVGIFVTKNGEIYVTDTKNYRIQKFDSRGKHLQTIESISKGKNKKLKKLDLLILPLMKKPGNSMLQQNTIPVVVYNKSGKLVREWGSNGKQDSQFRYPGSIVGMSDKRVAVVDILNTRVQVFRNKGKFSFQLSGFGVRPGFLVRPKGIALDKDEKIYISDSYMDVIQVFSPSGKFQHVLGSNGKPYRFISATGIAISNNKLYVTEPFKNKVSVFKLL